MEQPHNESLIVAIREFEAKVLDAFRLAEELHAASVKDAEATIATAREFVTKSNLLGAALQMYESTRHYHAWCKKSDWATWNAIGVTKVKEQTVARPDSSGFTWREHDWVFSLKNKRPSYSGDETFATLSVKFDEAAVMELTIATDHKSEFDRWRLVDVDAITVGPWIGALTQMAATMELAEQHNRLETDAALLKEQAARIKL